MWWLLRHLHALFDGVYLRVEHPFVEFGLAEVGELSAQALVVGYL